MASPDKNLLEAFQRIDPREMPAPEVQQSDPGRAPRSQRASGGRAAEAWFRQHPLSLAFASLLVGFALGVLFHRSATTAAVAQDRADPPLEAGAGADGAGAVQLDPGRDSTWTLPSATVPPTAGAPSGAPGGGQGAAQPSAASGLYDPANRLTVVCITYGNNRDREIQAAGVVRHLRELGIPAHDPVARGDKILVLVGAAPRAQDLDALAVRVRSQPDPSGQYGFRDAYIERIDDLISR